MVFLLQLQGIDDGRCSTMGRLDSVMINQVEY